MYPDKEACLHGVEAGVPQAIELYRGLYAELEYAFYWKMFGDLRTEAPTGMGINAIPASAIYAYAMRWKMTQASYEILDFIIRAVDSHHMAVQAKRQNKASESSE